ncbi:MAG: hypothetical protein M0P69_17360 [Bacteroidales bacterium]|jgi:hypothetical protein|nr:hypothetical protein [Bacteroidales bacterium]
MITMKSSIKTALLSAEIIKLLQGARVYAVKAPRAEEYPRITFFEMVNFDENYADDTSYSSRLVYQVDIWSKANPDPIAVEVDKEMKSIGFTRIAGADLYENDTQVYHRALRYGIHKEVGG